MDRLIPIDLANLSSAFALIGIKDQPLFNQIANLATPKIKSFSNDQLVDIAWAFGANKAAGPNEQFTEALLEELYNKKDAIKTSCSEEKVQGVRAFLDYLSNEEKYFIFWKRSF